MHSFIIQSTTTMTKSESMRQNPDMPTTPERDNASTCGFFTLMRLCAREFRNLRHTSAQRFRKCGENRRFVDQTPALSFRDLRFCCRKSGCALRFSIFPRTSGNPVRVRTRECPPLRGKPLARRSPSSRFRFFI